MARTNDVTEFLKFIIEMSFIGSLSSDYYAVDEHFLVVEGESSKPVTLTDPVTKEPRKILLYNNNMTKIDHLFVLNPFSEGLGEVPPTEWFWRIIRASLQQRLILAIDMLLSEALAEKARSKEKDKATVHMALPVLDIVSKIVDDVDDKMKEELKTLLKAPLEFSNIYYQKNFLSAIFRLGLFEGQSDWLAPIRKKTVGVLQTILRGLLKIDQDEKLETALLKYKTKAPANTPPRLTSTLELVFKIYSDMNEVLDGLDNDLTVPLGTLRNHLDLFPDYYQNARGWAQPIGGSAPPPSQNQQNAVPTPMGNAQVPPAYPVNVPTVSNSSIPVLRDVCSPANPGMVQSGAVPFGQPVDVNYYSGAYVQQQQQPVVYAPPPSYVTDNPFRLGGGQPQQQQQQPLVYGGGGYGNGGGLVYPYGSQPASNATIIPITAGPQPYGYQPPQNVVIPGQASPLYGGGQVLTQDNRAWQTAYASSNNVNVNRVHY